MRTVNGLSASFVDQAIEFVARPELERRKADRSPTMRTIMAQVLGITDLPAGVECAFVQRHLPEMCRLSHACMDSTIPRKRLADILKAINAMEEKYALRCLKVFHAGDGKLHPLILFDANDADHLQRCDGQARRGH